MKGYFYEQRSCPLRHSDTPEVSATGGALFCERENECPGGRDALPVLAYVKDQPFCGLYSACDGLERGTLFEQLDKPFEGKGCCKR